MIVRGYYHGLDTTSLAKLSRDIVLLSLEKDKKRKSFFCRKAWAYCCCFPFGVCWIGNIFFIITKALSTWSSLIVHRPLGKIAGKAGSREEGLQLPSFRLPGKNVRLFYVITSLEKKWYKSQDSDHNSFTCRFYSYSYIKPHQTECNPWIWWAHFCKNQCSN